MVARGEEWGERIVREFGINMYTLLYLKWIFNNKVLLYSTGNSAQCYVGGKFGGEWIRVYVWLSPFTVHLKLSKHCWLAICVTQSCWLCATPETAAFQAPLSLGFSRQEHWSGLPFPSPMHESEKWKWSRSVMSNSSRPHGLQPTRLLHLWDFPGKRTGVGCHCLFQFPTLEEYKTKSFKKVVD